MSWYRTKEDAEEACIWKKELYKEEFVARPDGVFPNCWWAMRLSLTKKEGSQNDEV